MKLLIAGLGMQGKAALYDLVKFADVSEIIVADSDFEELKMYVEKCNYGISVICEYLDASIEKNIDALLKKYSPDVVIELLPKECIRNTVEACIKNKIHMISSSFFPDSVKKECAGRAEKAGITMLHELGMDPGLDLIILGSAYRKMSEISDIRIYGSGIPSIEACNNSINYKESWTFEGVLSSYNRPAHYIEDGVEKELAGHEIFLEDNIHYIEVNELGVLEAFPNGNAMEYIDILKLDKDKLNNIGRYTMRWPGHCSFWRTMADLKLLDDSYVSVGGLDISKRKFLDAAIAPHIQYKEDEKDLGIIIVEIKGTENGKKVCRNYQIFDTRDLNTGFTAMNRLVGFTISIGAQMIAKSEIDKRGLAYTAIDVPAELLLEEMEKRDVHVTSKISYL